VAWDWLVTPVSSASISIVMLPIRENK